MDLDLALLAFKSMEQLRGNIATGRVLYQTNILIYGEFSQKEIGSVLILLNIGHTKFEPVKYGPSTKFIYTKTDSS